MDPDSGRLYPSVQDARAAGVENPVEISGSFEDVQHIASVLAVNAARANVKRLRKLEKKARRKNRG